MVKPFWLEPVEGLRRSEPDHRYWLGDHLFPTSVTGVLSAGMSRSVRRAIEAKRSIWEPRGVAVHAALECYTVARFRDGEGHERALRLVEELPQYPRYRDWILPLLSLPLWDHARVIASERLTCCLSRNLAGAFDGAYVMPELSDQAGSEVRVVYDLKTLSAHGRPYSTAAQLGGYMVLEESQGQRIELGQTIWCRPGESTVSSFYSREDCVQAWSARWSAYCMAQRPF